MCYKNFCKGVLNGFGNANCVEDTGELEQPSLNFDEDTSIRDDEWKQYDNLVVCLDNGHGEDTPGKRSPYASSGKEPALYFREYSWTREITKRLKTALEKNGVEVYMVCPETKDISLTTRYKRANNKQQEDRGKHHLFISVHANAASNGEWSNARGWCAFTTKGNTNSDKLAECLYDAAEEILIPMGIKIRKDLQDGDRDYEQNFTVIYGSNMPAVLTENLFQDNVYDVEFLLSEEGKEAIVELHRRGILYYAERYLGM